MTYSNNLFNSHFSKKVYLLKEYKEVDYFIKSTDQKDHNELINNLKKIAEISIIYNLNSNEIKFISMQFNSNPIQIQFKLK